VLTPEFIRTGEASGTSAMYRSSLLTMLLPGGQPTSPLACGHANRGPVTSTAMLPMPLFGQGNQTPTLQSFPHVTNATVVVWIHGLPPVTGPLKYSLSGAREPGTSPVQAEWEMDPLATVGVAICCVGPAYPVCAARVPPAVGCRKRPAIPSA